MAFYVDMYGEEYIKDFDGKTPLHYDSTLSPVRVQYLAIKPIWGNNVDGWHTYLSYYRPTGGTACSDEETRETVEVVYNTRDAAKAAAVEELKRDFRTMAVAWRELMEDNEKQEHWCFVCGKKLTGWPRYWVHITNGNQFVPADYDGEDSQGRYPVGNDCAKKPEIKPHVFK